MQVAGFYVALNVVWVLLLAVRVMRLRMTRHVGLGAGGDAVLERAIRVHGNAIEYVPLALVMLVALALEGLSPVWLHVFGISLLLARVLHALGLSRVPGVSPGRATGAGLTVLVMLAMAAVLIACFVTR